MLWLFVIFKGLLSCCFEVTLITIEIDPFMFLLFVKSQTTFVLCFVLTLITITYYPLMFRLFVHTQMTFLCCLVLTLITIRFDIHVFWFFMNPKIDFVVFSESSFVFLYVPCFDRVCTLIFLLVFALYSHWSQSNLVSPCSNWLWILRVCLYDVFMLRLFVHS